MRLKLERYHRDIRRQDHEALFKMRREQLLRAEEEEEAEIVSRRGRKGKEESEMDGENDQQQHNEADIYQQWRVDEVAMRRHSEEGAFGAVLNIVRSVHETLKEVRRPGRLLGFRKAQIHQTLLRSSMLSEMVRATMKAEREQCASGTLQALAVKSLSILKHLVAEQPEDFGELLFLQSDILPFLRLCANQAPYDKKHISRLILVAVHMLHISAESSGQLLRLMFTPGAVFGVGAIIYCISRNQLNPSQEVTINFLIFMKTCAQKAEEASDRSAHYKDQSLELPPFLTAAESDLLFELALSSAHYFLHHLEENEANLSLEQSLEVVHYLVEHAERNSKWLKRMDLKGFVNLLREKECPIEVATKILLIVDHLIFLDNSEADFSFQLVRGCELLPVIWAIKEDHFLIVSNIICNIATMQQFHEDMAPYLHHYFLAFRYDKSSYLLLHLMYNWLFAKEFRLGTSQDRLIITFLQDFKHRQRAMQPEFKDEKAEGLESLLWLSLIAANDIEIPAYVLEYDNANSQKLRDLLGDHQDLSPI